MAHRRAIGRVAGPVASEDLAGVGFGLAVSPSAEPDIEMTIAGAAVEGMERDDLRVLSLLVTWFGIHHERVNADRLTRLVATGSDRVRALWSALARWRHADHRFARLARAYRGPRIDLLPTGTEFQIARRGEDPRFAGSKLRVPTGVLRDRAEDALTPAQLAARHRGYYWRLVIGPTYRADAWARLERDPQARPAHVARAIGASYAVAWSARADFSTARDAAAVSGSAGTRGRRRGGAGPASAT